MKTSRWLGSLVFGMFMLAACANPSFAALSEGIFVPCSEVKYFANPSEKAKQYQIQKGDTLWDISAKYNIKLQTLMQLNKLNANSILTVGEKLIIPSDSVVASAGSNTTHKVKKGETMWDIASHYQMNVQTIVTANPKFRPDRLQIGDVLVIPERGIKLAALTAQEPSRGSSILPGLLSWPVVGTITSGYGWRQSGFHHGLDIAADMGTPIRAAADGVVIFAGYKDIYGQMVILEHLDGKQTVYAHAQKLMVKKNQKVKSGQIVATIGVSGRTTGPHLHFEVKTQNQTRDPLNYLRH